MNTETKQALANMMKKKLDFNITRDSGYTLLSVRLFPEKNIEKESLYHLIWAERSGSVTIKMAATRAGGHVDVLDQLKPDDVKEIFWRAVKLGLEKYITERYREVDICGEIKEKGYCQFCTPLLQDKEHVILWCKQLVEFYNRLHK